MPGWRTGGFKCCSALLAVHGGDHVNSNAPLLLSHTLARHSELHSLVCRLQSNQHDERGPFAAARGRDMEITVSHRRRHARGTITFRIVVPYTCTWSKKLKENKKAKRVDRGVNPLSAI